MKLLFAALVVTLSALAHAGPGEGPAQTLNAFHQAASEADLERYLGTMTGDMVFLGTDGSERWQGVDFRDFVERNFNAGRGWTYTVLERNVTIASDGQTAWFDEILLNDSLGKCRGSGVLVRSGRAWKIAQYNLSVPIPNSMVDGVAADIAALAGPAASVSTAGTTVSMTTQPVVNTSQTTNVAEHSAAARSSGRCARKRFKTNRKAGC